MLVRVDPTVGGATDERARAINMLRCIQAVCTAAAGSTPSVTPVTAPSTNGTGDCITEVISNAEAGGWTSSASTNVTTAYNASASTPYQVDLYNTSTGKSTYPYYKATFCTNYTYSFNNSYSTYPYIDMIFGFHTTTTADGNYSAGFNSYGTLGNQYSEYTSRNMGPWGLNPANATAYAANATYRAFRPAHGEYLIASTANYIIVMNQNFLGYTGIRSNAAWENNYSNNPYVIGFQYNCQGNQSAYNVSPNPGSVCNGIAAWGYGVDNSGLISPSPRWMHGQGHGASYSMCPIGGGTTSGSVAGYHMFGYDSFGGYTGTLMPFGLRSSNGNTMVGPSTDSATGANVPPAYPIVANFAGSTNHWQFSAIRNLSGMVLPGIYRSLAGSDAYMNQYYTAGTTYVVGSENYYPYILGNNATYRDLMLIRKY